MTAMQILVLCERLFLWAVLYSFLGWVYETILVSVQQRRFVNRGFLNGPLCPIYGTGAVLAIVVLTPLHNPAAMFLIAALGASVLEYVTSWVMERAFHARWWDYSHFRFNLNGRVCLLGAVVFGVFGVLIVDVVQPWVARWTSLISPIVLHVVAGVLALAILADFIVTVIGLRGFHARLTELADVLERGRAEFNERLEERRSMAADTLHQAAADAADRLHGRVRELSGNLPEPLARMHDTLTKALSWQQKRMIRSFPRLTSADYADLLKQLRDLLNRKRSR